MLTKKGKTIHKIQMFKSLFFMLPSFFEKGAMLFRKSTHPLFVYV